MSSSALYQATLVCAHSLCLGELTKVCFSARNSSLTFNKTRSTNSACPLKARFLHSPLSCTTIGKKSELSQGETLFTCHSGSCDSQSVPPTNSGASVLWRWVSLHCTAYTKRRLLHVGILFIFIFKKLNGL